MWMYTSLVRGDSGSDSEDFLIHSPSQSRSVAMRGWIAYLRGRKFLFRHTRLEIIELSVSSRRQTYLYCTGWILIRAMDQRSFLYAE
jgi:hypothetical protein